MQKLRPLKWIFFKKTEFCIRKFLIITILPCIWRWLVVGDYHVIIDSCCLFQWWWSWNENFQQQQQQQRYTICKFDYYYYHIYGRYYYYYYRFVLFFYQKFTIITIKIFTLLLCLSFNVNRWSNSIEQNSWIFVFLKKLIFPSGMDGCLCEEKKLKRKEIN